MLGFCSGDVVLVRLHVPAGALLLRILDWLHLRENRLGDIASRQWFRINLIIIYRS